MRRYSDSPELALIVALNTWVSSVLTNEWFHADVHAGNLLILTDGRVAFIDFGIVGSIPRPTADAMLQFVRAFPAGDMEGVAAALSVWTRSPHPSLPFPAARPLPTLHHPPSPSITHPPVLLRAWASPSS